MIAPIAPTLGAPSRDDDTTTVAWLCVATCAGAIARAFGPPAPPLFGGSDGAAGLCTDTHCACGILAVARIAAPPPPHSVHEIGLACLLASSEQDGGSVLAPYDLSRRSTTSLAGHLWPSGPLCVLHASEAEDEADRQAVFDSDNDDATASAPATEALVQAAEQMLAQLPWHAANTRARTTTTSVPPRLYNITPCLVALARLRENGPEAWEPRMGACRRCFLAANPVRPHTSSSTCSGLIAGP